VWAEFYQSRFEVPRVGDADTFAYYVEAKYKFTPELFGALRWNQQFFADVPDGLGGDKKWSRDVWRADAAVGYRFTPHTQLKLQYSLEHETGPRGTAHAFGAQFTVRFSD
jgi:predicted porin